MDKNTIKLRLSVVITLLALGLIIWMILARHTRFSPMSLASNLLGTLETDPELVVTELFTDDKQLDAAGTYLSYLSGEGVPKYKGRVSLSNAIGDPTKQKIPETEGKPHVVCIACNPLTNAMVSVSPVTSGTTTVLGADTDLLGLVLIPKNTENAAKLFQKCRFKVVMGLAGPTTISLYHPETDRYIGCLDGKCQLLSLDKILDYATVSFRLVTKDDFTVYFQTSDNRYLGFSRVGSRLEAMPMEAGITRFEIMGDDLNLLAGAKSHYGVECPRSGSAKEGFSGDNENSTRDPRDKRWVSGHVMEGDLNANNLDLFADLPSPTDTFADLPSPTDTFADLPSPTDTFADLPSPTEVIDDIFGTHTGKEFSDLMINYSKNKETSVEGDIYQKMEKAKMDPNVKTLLDYNEVRYRLFNDENSKNDNKIRNLSTDNTAQLEKMIRNLDQYKIQKLAQEYYFLKSLQERNKNKPI